MGKIYITGLAVDTLIGVYDWERQHKQRILVDLELQADLSKAAKSDNVDDTLNYALVAQKVVHTANDSQFKLIEALASHILDTLLQSFPLIQRAKLTLSKPDILANAKNVAVEMTRGRKV